MKEKLEVGGRWGQHQSQILNTKFKRRNSCCGPSHFKEKSIKEKKTIVKVGRTRLKEEDIGDDKDECKKNWGDLDGCVDFYLQWNFFNEHERENTKVLDL
jgi:hypothetical protein